MCMLAGMQTVWRCTPLFGVCLAFVMLSGCPTTSSSADRPARESLANRKSVSKSASWLVSNRAITSRVKSPILLVRDERPDLLKSETDEPWMMSTLARETSRPKPEILTYQHGTSPLTAIWKDLWFDDQPSPCCQCESTLCASDVEDDCEADSEICLGPCFRCDLNQGPGRLWEDVKGVVNWNNGLFLAVAAGAAVAIRETDADQEVREWAAEHPYRWGDGSRILNKVGDVRYQLPVLLGVYGYSVWTQDDELHDVTGTVLRAFAITSVSATALKYITNTDRPSKHWNNGHYGFPSHHTATSFAIAAVLDEYYGEAVGIPAYALAGAIGFSRIDEQDHDLSDVFFGGAMGFVIGKAVAGRHLCGNSKLKFIPYLHPTDGSPGIGCETRF